MRFCEGDKVSLRRPVSVAVFLATLLFGGAVCAIYSQNSKKILSHTPADKTDKSSENLVVNVDLINVLFTVTDRKGKLVNDLDRSNLKLYEDNKPQSITNFSRETDLPLSIALLIDTSTSIRDRFKFEQQAAIDFLYRTLRPNKDKALLITFDSAIELVQDYTDNAEVLAKAIRQVRPGGGTKMFDGIFLACQEKLKAE